MRLWSPIVTLVALASCSSPIVMEPEERLPADGPMRLEVTYAVIGPSGELEVGGLDRAAEPGAEIEIFDGDGMVLGQATADDDGRFNTVISGAAPRQVQLGVGTHRWTFDVRDPAEALEAAVRMASGSAGHVPNDLVALSSSDAPRAVLVRSGDDAISLIDPEQGLSEDSWGVRLPRGANPWFVTAIDADRVAVTGFGDHRVYVVGLGTKAIIATLELPEVVLEAPFFLLAPVDLDGDGVEESSIERFRPRAPQAIAVLGDRLFVAFSGYVAAGLRDRPPVWVPSVLASWSIADLTRPPAIEVLPALNAQELRADHRLIVVCTGAIDVRPSPPSSLTPGVVLIRGQGDDRRFDLESFAPSSAIVAAGSLWVSSLVRATVLRIDLETGETERFMLNDEAVDSVFRMVELPGGLIGAPSFNTDALHVIDPRARRVDPAPFFGAIRLGPGRPIFDGLQIMTRRPGRAGVDFIGPDLFALFGPASRLRAIDTRKVLGP